MDAHVQVVRLDMVRRAMLLNALVTGNGELAARHAHMLHCVLQLATGAQPPAPTSSSASAAVRLPHVLVNHAASASSGGGALLLVELHLADSHGAPNTQVQAKEGEANVKQEVEGAGAVDEAVEASQTLKQWAELLGRDAQPADTRTGTRFVMSARSHPLSVLLRNAPALGRLGVRAVTVGELASFSMSVSQPRQPPSSSAQNVRDGEGERSAKETKADARERTTAASSGADSGPAGWRVWALQAASGESAAQGSAFANWPVAYVGSQNAHVLALLDRLISSSDGAKICSLQDIGAQCFTFMLN